MASEEQFNETVNEPIDDLFAVDETDELIDSGDDEGLYPAPPRQVPNKATSAISSRRRGLYPTKPSVPPPEIKRTTVQKDTQNQSQRRRSQPSNYYHPNDYYLGTDWPRLIVGTLASLILLVGVGFLAFYLFDQFDTDTGSGQVLIPTNSETNIINAYQCAGDGMPLKQIESLPSALLSGKNASGTWVAFRDPDSPATQLWARSSDLPYNDFSDLEIVSCQNSSDS
ncbi:MAG: hypothetical protein VX353_00425 [Actinomycetota bacterium]